MSTGVAQLLQADRLKYPGLSPAETIVLRAWLASNESQFDHFDYNIRIGPEQDPGPQYSAPVRKSSILGMQLRIDAVGWRGIQASLLTKLNETPAEVYALFPSALATIIEVKRRATASAVGEIVTYFHQWRSENPQAPAPDLLLVCNTYSPNIVATLQGQGIQLNTVVANFSILRPRRT